MLFWAYVVCAYVHMLFWEYSVLSLFYFEHMLFVLNGWTVIIFCYKCSSGDNSPTFWGGIVNYLQGFAALANKMFCTDLRSL